MESPLNLQLQQILADQVLCQNRQDLPGVLRLIHRNSFSYQPTEQMLMNVFATYQLRLELLERKLLAVDGDCAFMRFELKSEKLQGPDFRDNIADSLVVFRKLEGQWKIWWQTPIDFRML